MAFLEILRGWFSTPEVASEPLTEDDKRFLQQTVSFYTGLSEQDKKRFEQRSMLFLQTVEVVGHDIEIERADELLVAAGSVILAWGFDQWHYVRVDTVILVPASFNEQSKFGQHDSNIQGLVGNQHLAGKMILSKPALHAGFSNDKDKRNVALHEFSHLIDMADGDADGFPAELAKVAFGAPWIALVKDKMKQIQRGDSNIRHYGATSEVEFFAVATEYFFERPKMLERKHPQVYKSLTHFYKQDRAELKEIIKPRKKDPCPCGSGKRYKRCCLPA